MQSISPSDKLAAEAALQVLGTRLRDIRRDAGLMGRDLAEAAGWQASKITRIERAQQRPSETDIATWCRICDAGEQLPDLIAMARNVEGMYLELRRSASTGMKRLQDSFTSLWEATSLFRVYEPFIVPGLFQTADYARTILAATADRLNAPNDLDAALAARMKRQEILYHGSRRFMVVIEEHVLTTQIADATIMLAQLDRLLAVMSSQRCSLGIVPAASLRRHALPSEGFWIYDDNRAMVETRSAIITVKQAREIAIYTETFDRLQRSAVYGAPARERIMNAIQSQS